MARRGADAGSARRTFRIDPRFVVGIVLVLASVAGVYAIVAAADRTTDVYVARDALVVGQSVDRSDVVLTSVRLGPQTGRYLGADGIPDGGLVMTRSVLAGELVPASAVASAAESDLTTVVVSVHGRLPAQVEPGSVVDLWSARAVDNAAFDAPAVLVSGATVARVAEADGLIRSDTGQSVEVLVPRAKVAVLLEAVANEDAVSVVPSGG
ncbi:MAG: hypothetical protein ABWY36_00240 [Leifsonia sp.]